MQRLRVISQPSGMTLFREEGTDSVWCAAPATPIEHGLRAEAVPSTPRVALRSFQSLDDAESVFASWSSAGWEAFETHVRHAMDRARDARPDTEVLLWPGAGSVLSDGVSTLSFARKHPSVGLVIDPVSWITDAMRADAEDHLVRFAQAMSLCGSLKVIVVRAVERAGTSPALDASAVEALLAPAIRHAGVVAFA